MIYLSRFVFPDADREFDFRLAEKRRCYDTYYPFHVLSARGLGEIEPDYITILYGGNGSGKTTALNVVGEKLGLKRDAPYNRSNFFEDYTALCSYEIRRPIPRGSRIITSDDVFDFMLNLRALNEGIDLHREELFQEYIDNKSGEFHLRSMADYEQLKQVNLARKTTQSRYVRRRMPPNAREHSNGESAYDYFTQNIGENQLYLLDEPENSLSPQRQMELAQFIEESVRFFGCQFLIATHSPFLLAMKDARVYDLDADPARVRKWTELSSVRAYYDFFRRHRAAFETDEGSL
ncbi:MAG: AAA family ATPase [Clostridia bacterium]|nr:AAA family ATPase [Clostridia bacterium]